MRAQNNSISPHLFENDGFRMFGALGQLFVRCSSWFWLFYLIYSQLEMVDSKGKGCWTALVDWLQQRKPGNTKFEGGCSSWFDYSRTPAQINYSSPGPFVLKITISNEKCAKWHTQNQLEQPTPKMTSKRVLLYLTWWSHSSLEMVDLRTNGSGLL